MRERGRCRLGRNRDGGRLRNGLGRRRLGGLLRSPLGGQIASWITGITELGERKLRRNSACKREACNKGKRAKRGDSLIELGLGRGVQTGTRLP